MSSALVQTILDDFQTDSDINRQDVQSKRMDMYLDDYKKQIEDELETQFEKENSAVLKPLIARYDNVFKKIVNLKARSYKDTPKRVWRDSNKEESEDYADILEESNVDSEMITVEKWAFVNNISFVRVIPKPELGIIEYEAVSAENISVDQDENDPMTYHAIHHRIVKNNTPGNHSQIIHLWTDGQSSVDDEDFPNGFFQKWEQDEKGNFIETPKTANPYVDPDLNRGVIPYIDFRTVRGVDFWAETINEDLRLGTLNINVDETHHNNLTKFAGYRQIFITGDTDTAKLQNQKTDVLAAIVVSPIQGQTVPTVQALDHTNDPNQLLQAIQKKKAILADNHGVSFSADGLASGQRQTAEAMTINRQQLIELRKDVLPLFRNSEKRLAKATIIIANTSVSLGGLGMSIDIKGKFSIDYQEPKIVTDEKTELETDLLKEINDLTSKVDLVIKYNPDIKSEEEAMEFLKRNREIKEELRQASLLATGTQNVDQEIANAVANVQGTEEEDEQTPPPVINIPTPTTSAVNG